MSDKIPPRPWAVDRYGGCAWIVGRNDGEGSPRVADCYENGGETADLIVRLVNAEPEIVAALEEAEFALSGKGGRVDALVAVRAALAKVRPGGHLISRLLVASGKELDGIAEAAPFHVRREEGEPDVDYRERALAKVRG